MFKFTRYLIISQLFISAAGFSVHASIFGEETGVLLSMLSNQLTELQRLAESVGIAKEQQNLLLQINDGVQKTTERIRTLEVILERAQGLNPIAIKNISDLNDAVGQMKNLAGSLDQLVQLKLALSDDAISSAAVQSDTTYTMGQEMVKVGKSLHEESATASPGRSQQITAWAASSQMIAMGIELQTLSQMVQLQTIALDLQKSQIERQLAQEKSKNDYIRQALTGKAAPQPSKGISVKKPKKGLN